MILILFAAILAFLSNAQQISGTVTPSNSEVKKTSVTYQFDLSARQQIPTGGKLVVRFPADYVDSFTVSSCSAKSGFATPCAALTCTWQQSVRILTITSCLPTSGGSSLSFLVNGVTNPQTTKTTDNFKIQSFRLVSGTTFTQLDSSDGSIIQMNPTPGAITTESLTLSVPTVSVFSTLSVGMKAQHSIPKDGIIEITLPKWNSFAQFDSQKKSLIAVSTNPGTVSCSPVTGITSLNNLLTCELAQGASEDIFRVYFTDLLTADIAAETYLTFEVEGVRGPPSVSAMTGFSFRTLTASGSIIDKSLNPSSITLANLQRTASSPSNVQLTVSSASINVEATLQIMVANVNPLPANSGLTVVIPADFGVVLSSMTLQGVNIQSNPMYTFSASTNTLTISSFNTVYLQERSFFYISIATVVNPGKTEPTASFSVLLSDNNGRQVEAVTEGVTFSPIAGGFASVSLTASDTVINRENVKFTFTFTPDAPFLSGITLKLVFPPELQLASFATLSDATGEMDISQARWSVEFNKNLLIKNAFPNGFAQTGPPRPFSFTVSGVTNPPTVAPTNPFQLAIFYEEYVNEVAKYSGVDLIFTATPSDAIELDVKLSANQTGQTNDKLTFVGRTVGNLTISMGSSLEISIPNDFKIANAVRTASSCTAVSGFSDQIICEFTKVDSRAGYVLKVTNGFDSATFTAGEFRFFISEVQNPFTTDKSGKFGLKVFDKNSELQYFFNGTTTAKVSASPFSFAFVESTSTENGVSSIYKFSLTIAVDTPAASVLMIGLPDDLEFDDTMPFTCLGTMNIVGNLTCYERNKKVIHIRVMSDTARSNYIINGTTISFQLGYIKNAISLAKTKSFFIQTYRSQDSQNYWINEQMTGLEIRNSKPGTLTQLSITQDGSKELGHTTSLAISFWSEIAIPTGSVLTVKLPTNIMLDASVVMTVNQQLVATTVSQTAYTLQATVLQNASFFKINISSGIKNPTAGPYSYEYFSIGFADSDGYAINQILSRDVWVDNACEKNCASCNGDLGSCTSCSHDPIQNKTFYLQNNACVEHCVEGTFQGSGYLCQPCQEPCIECNYKPTLCLRCNPNTPKPFALPSTLQCFAECPEGTYLDEEEGLCKICESPCFTCVNKTHCLSCDRDQKNLAINYFNQTLQCYETCPDISVPSPSKNCVSCASPCIRCQDKPDSCLSCEDGLFLLKDKCVDKCPFGYFKNTDDMKCLSTGELEVPFPFTIVAIIMSVGLGLSHFMKGSAKDNTEQEGTVFAISALAFVDLLLRINWIVLAVTSYQKQQMIQLYLYLAILGISTVLNLGLWRKFFNETYNFDEDLYFAQYITRYPRTAKFLLFLSYFVAFQTIRLTYSRLLGKKQFMARFYRRKLYFKMIGRMTLLQILFLYCPVIALNIYSLLQYKMYTTPFYLVLDSLILVAYAVILIIVVMTQREKALSAEEAFNFCELFSFGAIQEMEEEPIQDIYGDSFKGDSFKKDFAKGVAVMGGIEEDEPDLDDRLEVRSAAGYHSHKRMQLYQKELLEEVVAALPERQDEYNSIHEVMRETSKSPRPVATIDYSEYRKLEDKKDELLLKKNLYDRRRNHDKQEIAHLDAGMKTANKQKIELNKKIAEAKKQIAKLQKSIIHTEASRKDAVERAEQRKREEIVRRRGVEIPSAYQSQSPAPNGGLKKDSVRRSVSNSPTVQPAQTLFVMGQPLNSKAKKGKKTIKAKKSKTSKGPQQSVGSEPEDSVEHVRVTNPFRNDNFAVISPEHSEDRENTDQAWQAELPAGSFDNILSASHEFDKDY